jgi:hypothetical protein
MPLPFNGYPAGHAGPPGPNPHFYPSLPPGVQAFGPVPGTPPAFYPGPHQHQIPPPHMNMHRSRPSLALMNGPSVPATPLNQAAFMPHMAPMGGLNSPQPGASFQPGPGYFPRSRRNPSTSTGGPPKAALGGPARKQSLLPAVIATNATEPVATPVDTKVKGKKASVKLPVESYFDEAEGSTERQYHPWARKPLPSASIPLFDDLPPPEITSIEINVEPWSKYQLPDTVEVFLPGKVQLLTT